MESDPIAHPRKIEINEIGMTDRILRLSLQFQDVYQWRQSIFFGGGGRNFIWRQIIDIDSHFMQRTYPESDVSGILFHRDLDL